jgi:hypothetical protein
MNDPLNYSPRQRIVVAPKPTRATKKPPFGLFIASFSLTFMAIFACFVSYNQDESVTSQVQSFSKNSKQILKEGTAKLKKISAN